MLNGRRVVCIKVNTEPKTTIQCDKIQTDLIVMSQIHKRSFTCKKVDLCALFLTLTWALPVPSVFSLLPYNEVGGPTARYIIPQDGCTRGASSEIEVVLRFLCELFLTLTWALPVPSVFEFFFLIMMWEARLPDYKNKKKKKRVGGGVGGLSLWSVQHTDSAQSPTLRLKASTAAAA